MSCGLECLGWEQARAQAGCGVFGICEEVGGGGVRRGGAAAVGIEPSRHVANGMSMFLDLTDLAPAA